MNIDTFQIGADEAGIVQIQVLLNSFADDAKIEALCNLAFCYGDVAMFVDICSEPVSYFVAQSPAAQFKADLFWVAYALSRFEQGWKIDENGRLHSPVRGSHLSAGQVREALLGSKNAAMQPIGIVPVA